MLENINEYTTTNVVELSEDIDYLLDHKPTAKNEIKAWKHDVQARMDKYNQLVNFEAYGKLK